MMLFRIPASHTQVVYAIGPATDISASVLSAFDALGWTRRSAAAGFAAEVGASFWSWGEIITVLELGHGRFSVDSRCRMPLQIVDWGKNRQNVEDLCARLGSDGFVTEGAS